MAKADKLVWSDPELGSFKHEYGEWRGIIRVPSFSIFDSTRPNGLYQLTIEGPPEGPEEQLVDAVLDVVRAEAELADNLLKALWDQMMGIAGDPNWVLYGVIPDKSPELSLIWGDPPRSPLDLATYIDNPTFGVTSRWGGPNTEGLDPEVRISFSAFWDVEHGLGFLVKGSEILGIGNAIDVEPFGGYPPRAVPLVNPFTGEIIGPPDRAGD